MGYINTGTIVLEPYIYQNANLIHSLWKHLLNRTKKFIFRDGEFVEVNPGDAGDNGVLFLYKNWDNIDWDKYENDKNRVLIENFKTHPKSYFFSQKILVLPVAFRPYVQKHGRITIDPITELYEKIIRTAAGSEFMVSAMNSAGGKQALIQKYYNSIYETFMSTYKTKAGEFQSNYSSKRTDSTATMVANANPEVPTNSCVIPWHILLVTFDVFVLAMLTKMPDIAEKLGFTELSDINKLSEHFQYIQKNPDIYEKSNPEHKQIWIDLLEHIFNTYPDLGVMLKRNPAFEVKSYVYFKVIINTQNESVVLVPSYIYNNLGADSFVTNFYIYNTEDKEIFENERYTLTVRKYSSLTPTYKVMDISTLGDYYGNL